MSQVIQASDDYLGLVTHIIQSWGGLLLGVCNLLTTVFIYLCCRCRRSREIQRVRRNFLAGRSSHRRRRLVALSDGTVTDLTDLEMSQCLNDSVFSV